MEGVCIIDQDSVVKGRTISEKYINTFQYSRYG